MSIIKQRYDVLTPKGMMLGDVVVLAQAWKKSHAYIRRHNWYADMLELDSSIIDLEQHLERWGEDIEDPEFGPSPLLLIPAPKNSKWIFKSRPKYELEDLTRVDLDAVSAAPIFDDWASASSQVNDASLVGDSSRKQKLRPLAHISIRDQTLATAVMMCLAEVVEQAQGDPTESDLVKARANGMASYGNRLNCNWVEAQDSDSIARFSWGNSLTYRQYFQDYRAFLARSRRVCSEFSPQLPQGKELFVVSLDIKAFYDRIDVSALLKELQRIELEHRRSFGLPDSHAADDTFWNRTARIFDWHWKESEHSYAEIISESGAQRVDLGLPQGLVASGFLANAYLIGLDRGLLVMAEEMAEVQDGLRILDYCRYVDDIRIVVEASSGTGGKAQADVLGVIKGLVTRELISHCKRLGAARVLELSEDKSVITPYRSISAQSSLSAIMDVLNAELSGTFDLESLTEAAGGLDGLLWMSDQIDNVDEPKPSRLSLASIAVPNTDVRDDTVKRFVATRLAQLMRHRLAMTDGAAPAENGEALSERVTNGAALAHEFESTARKLLKCWAENPSLVLLLRCGLDLYPHPKLLAPVVEALAVKLFVTRSDLDAEQQKETRVAEYVTADLFRAGAVEIGFRGSADYPETIDIPGFREDLGVFARRIILERTNSPWYLLQPALLYLASIGDLSAATTHLDSVEELKRYQFLFRAMVFEPAQSRDLVEVLPFAMVAQQMNPNPRRFGVWLAEGLRSTKDQSVRANIVTTVSLNRPDLMMAALNTQISKRARWKRFVPRSLIEVNRSPSNRSIASAGRSVLSLSTVMHNTSNPFSQENGVLMLARTLLMDQEVCEGLGRGLTGERIVLECADWSRIQSLPSEEGFLSVQPTGHVEVFNPLYETPPWVDETKAWLYGLGRILRSALTGEFDFTSRRYVVTEDIGRYSGLRSTWFKRRFGLLNSGRGLLEEPGPVSPWLSGLLSTLLQWPGVGFRANEVVKAGFVGTPEELLMIIEARIAEQKKLFGARSNTPMYVVPTDDHAPLEDRPIRIAIIQTLRPRRDEFNVKDPAHWPVGDIAQHRRHLAEVCRLAHQKLRTWDSAQALTSTEDEGARRVVDVVLFPELAVHPEHVFLLRRLSDLLRANIFAGLTFLKSPLLGTLVNQGIWLIRTESPRHGRSIQYVWQGKLHPTRLETSMGIKGHRPHLTLVELPVGIGSRTRIAAAICYDATDLDLVADLRDRSDIFLVAALNQDVQTFDNMVAALHFHMYQPIVLANTGEFGGSTAQAPLPKHERLISHVHGNNQVAVSVFEIDPEPFKSIRRKSAPRGLKNPPAGYRGRPV